MTDAKDCLLSLGRLTNVGRHLLDMDELLRRHFTMEVPKLEEAGSVNVSEHIIDKFPFIQQSDTSSIQETHHEGLAGVTKVLVTVRINLELLRDPKEGNGILMTSTIQVFANQLFKGIEVYTNLLVGGVPVMRLSCDNSQAIRKEMNIHGDDLIVLGVVADNTVALEGLALARTVT